MTVITTVASFLLRPFLAMVVTIVIFGCGGTAEPGPASPTLTIGLPEVRSTKPTEIALQGMPELDGKAFQDELLKDGVTEAEYERAVLTTLQCLVDGGGAYFDLQWGEHRGFRKLRAAIREVPGFEPGVDPSIYDACWAEWSRAVEGQWAIQHEPTEEELQAMKAVWVACVQERGLEVHSWDEGPTLSGRFGEAGHNAFYACNLESGIGGGPPVAGSGLAP